MFRNTESETGGSANNSAKQPANAQGADKPQSLNERRNLASEVTAKESPKKQAHKDAKLKAHCFIYVPELVITRVNSFNLYPWNSLFYKDKLFILVSTILYHYYSNKGSFSRNNGFVTLSSRALGSIIGKNCVSSSAAALSSLGIIEVDHSYQSTKDGTGYCKSYRVKESYLGPCRRIKIKSAPVAQKLLSLRQQKLKEAIHEFKLHSYVHSTLDRLSFSAQAEEIMQASDLYTWNESLAYIHSYYAVIDKAWFLTRDPKTGRIFNPVTSMPRLLRSCLLIDGRPTVEVDIKNSQPLLLATLYPETSLERSKYLSVVQRGTFYEEIQHASGLSAMSREDVKKLILTHALYGRDCWNESIRKGFVSLFPELWSLIWGAKKEDYKALPLRMQKLEADCMITGVLAEIAALPGNIPALTIHDGVITLQEHTATILASIKNNVSLRCGYTPQVLVKAST